MDERIEIEQLDLTEQNLFLEKQVKPFISYLHVLELLVRVDSKC